MQHHLERAEVGERGFNDGAAARAISGASNLWLTNADGSGSPTRLTTSPNAFARNAGRPNHVHPDRPGLSFSTRSRPRHAGRRG